MPDTLPGIDLDIGLKRVNGNRKLFRKLLYEFYHDYHDIIAKIRTRMDQSRDEEVDVLTHTVKGIAGSLGANRLHGVICDFETALQEKRSAQYADLLGKFEDELLPVLQGLSPLMVAVSNTTENSDLHQEESTTPVDTTTLEPLFRELVPLLENGYSSSEAKLLEIIENLSGNEQVKELQRIQQQVEDYDYDEALETLAQVAQSMGVSMD